MRRGMMGNPELQKALALTAAQQAKIKAINDKYIAKFRAAGTGMKFTPGQRPDAKQMEAMRAKMKPIRDAMEKEISAVLTAKQRDTLKKWRDSHKGFGGMRGPGGPGGPRPGGGGVGTGGRGGAGHGG
jgi:Spy/CpxP family protein refolding chaperone